LVENLGFSALAMEVSYPEAVAVDDYVLDGKGDPALALSRLRFWITDTNEMLELIRWMRSYNAHAAHRQKLRFTGIDMQFPPDAALRVLDYLRRVDAGFVREIGPLLGPVMSEFDSEKYLFLAHAIHRRTTDAVARLAARLDDNHQDYVKRSTEAEWVAARDLARVLVQAEELARTPRDQFRQVRDRFMADNVLRLARDGSKPRILVSAANQHIQVETDWNIPPMGSYLRAALGTSYRAIGLSFNQGSFNAVGMSPLRDVMAFTVAAAPPDRPEAAFSRTGLPAFVIDFRSPVKSAPVSTWLSSKHRLRQFGLAFSEAWGDAIWRPVGLQSTNDAMAFFDTISPSHLRHPRPAFLPPRASVPCNLGFEETLPDGAPPGWYSSPLASRAGYRVESVRRHCKGGLACVRISRGGAIELSTYGGLTQDVDAANYRGHGVRVRGAVRVERRLRSDRPQQAELWVAAVDRKGQIVGFAGMADHPIVSDKWGTYEVSARVPAEAEAIRFGIAVDGDAPTWLDELSVERIE
jgi:erythromycin esterase-like protein